jgi:hypothetical protein
MSTTAFMSEGATPIPQGSALTDMTTQSVLPDWYTNPAMEVIAKQKALSNLDYVAPPMDRVAQFSDATKQGFDMTGTAATAYQPALTAATNATQGAINAPGGLATAQPYLTQAGQSSVSNIAQYMNPYNDAVVNRIGELGARNLSELIMPEIEGRYIKAGQLNFGGRGGLGTPSGMMTDTARAVRDVSSDILAQQNLALQQGYNAATSLSGADLTRQAGLATTAGNLQAGDVERKLAGAEQLAGLGADAQKLGLTGAGALTAVGAAQEAKVQQNLDVALADWMKEQGYPQEQIDNMVKTMSGVSGAVPKAETQYGIGPSGGTNKSTSEAADILSAAATAAGVIFGDKP